MTELWTKGAKIGVRIKKRGEDNVESQCIAREEFQISSSPQLDWDSLIKIRVILRASAQWSISLVRG